MDDKRKDDGEETDGKEPEEEKSTKSSIRGKSKPSEQKKKRVDKDEEQGREDEEDDDEEDDEDEEDDDEEDEDDDDEEEEEEQPKPPKKAVKPKKAEAKAVAAKKKAPEQVVKLPSELPLPPRNSEIMTGLVLAIAGYLAFWYGWSVYSLSIEKRHASFFSNSAWAFLIAFFLVIMAAQYFVRQERKEPEGGKKGASKPKVADTVPAKVDRLGVLLAVLVCGPFYGVYWWKAHTIWSSMYAGERPVMWVIYVAALALMSVGVFHGLRPPTHQEEQMRRIPGRRILLLLMSPFALVYGMIYLAGLHPPWP